MKGIGPHGKTANKRTFLHDRSPRQRRRDSPRQLAHVEERVAAAEPRADTTPPAAATAATAATAAGAPTTPTTTNTTAPAVAADGEAGLGAVVVRRRLPGERHVQQNRTGRKGRYRKMPN